MPKPNCPICGNNQNTFRIDDIYFKLLENDPTINQYLKEFRIQKNQILKKLHPPALDKQPIWKIIPPDTIASIFLFFFLFLSIFNLLNGTKNALLISALTVILFIIFLIFRNNINKTYQIHQNKRDTLIRETTKKVDLWSGLFICLPDGKIFNSDHSINLEVDQFQNFLNDIE